GDGCASSLLSPRSAASAMLASRLRPRGGEEENRCATIHGAFRHDPRRAGAAPADGVAGPRVSSSDARSARRGLLGVALERPAALFLLLAVLAGAGVWMAARLPSSIFPSVTFPRVKIIAEAGEEPTAQMIPAVARPLEEAVLRVPGIERVTSTSTRGSVEIGAEFSWGADMVVALQRVQAEIERTRPDLPPGIRVEAQWMNTAIFPILGYALTSDTRSQSDLRELADFTLKPELIQIPGVSQVQVQGGRLREF